MVRIRGRENKLNLPYIMHYRFNINAGGGGIVVNSGNIMAY